MSSFVLNCGTPAGLHKEIQLEILAKHAPEHHEHYKSKVALLTAFSSVADKSTMLRCGGFSLLPLKLSWMLRQGFEASLDVVDIPSPDFTSPSSPEEMDDMVRGCSEESI